MIGIVGASGEIGVQCVNLLNEYNKVQIKIGVRNINSVIDNQSNKVCEFIDVRDELSCIKFVKDCDCVVNCTNVTGENIYNLINAACKYNVKFIDVNYHMELNKKVNAAIYHGVGASPGLTEALPMIMKNKFEKITGIKLYYLTVGKFTISAAKEYLKYIKSGEVFSATILKNGIIVPNMNDNLRMNLPFTDEEWITLPYMDKRILNVCKKLNLKNAEFYMCLQDGYTYEFLKNIASKSNINEEKIVKELVNLSAIDCSYKKNCSGFIIEAEGIKSEHNHNVNLIIKSPSPSRLTALVVVSTALLSLKEKSSCVIDMSSLPFENSLLNKMAEIDPLFFYKIYENETIDLMHAIEGEL